ncbi:hypothetical protein [Paraburkholderia guartelaensis]|uniref:Uncharacterized protein n=1 Tax=Paraburkholderia guartelaensis TaxID=2546446 RepID=A0ABU9SJM3_9BURK
MTEAKERRPAHGGPKGGDTTERVGPDRRSPFSSPQALEAWFEAQIARELKRCRAAMNEDDWQEHRAWIEANARASLREAVERYVRNGAS